jgi:polysaccharide biosynthesis/export protein
MRHKLFTLFFLLTCIGTDSAIAAEKANVYKLYPGDSATISVWREDTLQKQVIVLPDGSITFPLIGRVEVSGLSTTEVEQLLTTKLKAYLPDPVVTVVIVGIEGHRAYVTGKVLHPGSVILNGPITVLQAISLVGGFDRFADQGGIKVIRTTAEGQEVISVEYSKIISGKDMSTNVQLKTGDTLIVP